MYIQRINVIHNTIYYIIIYYIVQYVIHNISNLKSECKTHIYIYISCNMYILYIYTIYIDSSRLHAAQELTQKKFPKHAVHHRHGFFRVEIFRVSCRVKSCHWIMGTLTWQTWQVSCFDSQQLPLIFEYTNSMCSVKCVEHWSRYLEVVGISHVFFPSTWLFLIGSGTFFSIAN